MISKLTAREVKLRSHQVQSVHPPFELILQPPTAHPQSWTLGAAPTSRPRKLPYCWTWSRKFAATGWHGTRWSGGRSRGECCNGMQLGPAPAPLQPQIAPASEKETVHNQSTLRKLSSPQTKKRQANSILSCGQQPLHGAWAQPHVPRWTLHPSRDSRHKSGGSGTRGWQPCPRR